VPVLKTANIFTKGDTTGRNMKQIVLRLVTLLNDELLKHPAEVDGK
jgi:hypothetical protein